LSMQTSSTVSTCIARLSRMKLSKVVRERPGDWHLSFHTERKEEK